MTSDSASQHPDIIMRLEGSGAADLLHGQTTADFSACQEGDVRYAAFCNPKGRVLADVRVVVIHENEMLLRGRREVMLRLAEHLKPFLAFARSTLAPTDWQVSITSAEGTTEKALLERLDASLERVALPAEGDWQEIWSSTSAHPEDAGDGGTWHDILAARARVETATVGAYLPQDLNYDLNQTVSFSKGCYTGQEIVARLHYRGTPKRRLHRAALDVGAEPGDLLVNAGDQTVGSVVNSCSRADVNELLIELVPDAANETIALKTNGAELSNISRCHSEIDQSTGPR